MKVYERLAEAFIAEGTKHDLRHDGRRQHVLDECTASIAAWSSIEVRHEGVGLGMADGWRASHARPGVATATCGPGVTQLATALVTAARAESPVVAFVGEHPASDQDYHQRLNQAAFAAGCETGFIRLATPEFADEAVRRAFYLAKLESRPIMLSAPMDTQQKEWDDDEPYKPSSSS